MWSFLKGVLVDNLALKALSLGLAVVLFLIVRADKAAVASGYVVVEYQFDESTSVMVTKPPLQLRISVRGPWSKVNRFDDRTIQPLRIKAEVGKRQVLAFQPDMIELPRGLRVVAISPPSAEIQVERLLERKVPVTVRLVGDPAQGYALQGQPRLNPDTVLLRGPESALERLAASGLLLPVLDVTNAEKAVEVSREVITALPEHTRALTSMQVRVHQQVVAQSGERAFAEVAVVPTGFKEHSQVPVLDLPAVGVWLDGPMPVLHGIDPKSLTLVVDFSQETARLSGLPMRIKKALEPANVRGVPAGVTATRVVPPHIMVSFTRKEPTPALP